MEQPFERVWGLTGGDLTTTGAALLLMLALVAGERSLAPLMMERPDDRTLTDVLATDAVYRHVASYATRPDQPQEILTIDGRTQDE